MLSESTVSSCCSEDSLCPIAQKQLDRLNRRVEREIKIRMDAERIAERQTRMLWLANQELDQRVAERTADLKETLGELEQASNVVDEFMANLSHEIRTPLFGILGMLELLTQHVEAAEGVQFIESARESADRLLSMLSRLLNLLELTTGRVEAIMETKQVSGLVDEVRERWERPAMHNGRLFVVGGDGESSSVFELDQLRFAQVVDELVDNSIHHSNPGIVRVEFCLEEPQDSPAELVIDVIDPGPGLLNRGSTQSFGDSKIVEIGTNHGLGIGLEMTKRLVQMLGGSIAFDGLEDESSVTEDDENRVESGHRTRVRIPVELKTVEKPVLH